jgi:hypothetical protein
MNATIIYCSSNKENEMFENIIKHNILKNCGGLPIVSVTQKPIDFGTNICVGEVGVSGYNFFKQTLIACKEAETPYVICCEADTLYPPDHFEFIPPRPDVAYRNSNLYVMGNKRNYFYKKFEGATHSQVVGRQFYIDTLEKLFEGCPEWSQEKNFPKERYGKEDVFDKIEYWESENPVVQIKTGDSMRHYTHSDRTPIYSIPYWGNGKEVAKIKQ